MVDLLVRLYDLPDPGPRLAALKGEGVIVRRAMAYERRHVLDWIARRFGDGWAGEAASAFGPPPANCFLAVRDGTVLGFACIECTCKGFFGPAGVEEDERGRGVGTGLLLAALHAMRESGYAYAVIGGAGSVAFYERVVGAVPIEGSDPGVYRDRLRRPGPDP
jgi:GNAT superfamily N-acetyltransferase